MNKFIENQINTMTAYSKAFIQACKLAALEDDGEISKEEKKKLALIEKHTSDFINKINKLK